MCAGRVPTGSRSPRPGWRPVTPARAVVPDCIRSLSFPVRSNPDDTGDHSDDLPEFDFDVDGDPSESDFDVDEEPPQFSFPD
ncbi:hypothetical protein [Halorientalis regularis]|uniref:hypothetical protein n=1 Tax=Halorientalis regularis TaxID=660518 RepID=UPI000B8A1B17|nr:hypothetical protein [Halorientalis regularis]